VGFDSLTSLFNLQQGDHIGRFLAYWAIVIFGQSLKTEIAKYLWGTFPRGKSWVCFDSDKNVLGHMLGDYFPNSSGHPGSNPGRV
jgi:hypothetical protein